MEPQRRKSCNRRVAGTVMLVTLGYAALAVNRYLTFKVQPFDTGVFANVLWRLAHGYDDVSALTGVHHFADHPSGLVLGLVPMARVAGDLIVPLLLVLQAMSVGLVGWATWRIASVFDLSAHLRWLLLAAALIGPGAYFAAVGEFHESGLALGPLAMTIAGGLEERQTRLYWIWPLLAALARVELALAILILGLVLWRLGRRRPANGVVWIGATVSLLLVGWLVFNPWEGASVSGHLGHLGSSPGEALGAAIRTPGVALEPLLNTVMIGALAFWLLQFGILAPLRGAAFLLPALPLIAIPILGSWPPADPWYEHYWHVLLPLLPAASAYGMTKNDRARRLSPALIGFGIILTWVFLGPFSSATPDFLRIQPLRPDVASEQQVVETVPGSSISAPGQLVPHLADRESIHWFPLPFVCSEAARNTIPGYRSPTSPPEVVIEEPESPMTDDEREQLDLMLVTGYYPRQEIGPFVVWDLVDVEASKAAMGACR